MGHPDSKYDAQGKKKEIAVKPTNKMQMAGSGGMVECYLNDYTHAKTEQLPSS